MSCWYFQSPASQQIEGVQNPLEYNQLPGSRHPTWTPRGIITYSQGHALPESHYEYYETTILRGLLHFFDVLCLSSIHDSCGTFNIKLNKDQQTHFETLTEEMLLALQTLKDNSSTLQRCLFHDHKDSKH